MTAAHYEPRLAHRDRRPQPPAAGRAHRGDQAAGAARRQVGQLRLGGARGRRARPRRAAGRVRARRSTGRPVAVIAHTIKGKGVSFMEDRVEWHHKVPDAEQVAGRARGADPMTAAAAATPRPTTAARRSPRSCIALAREDERDRRRLQRLRRLEQPRRLPRGVPRPADQRRHRRAGPRRRRRRPGQRRAASRSSRAAAPFLTGRALEQIKADVGVQRRPRRAVRPEPRHGLRRAGADPPLDRGPVLDAGDRRPARRRAGRPRADPRRRALGGGASPARPTCASRASRCPAVTPDGRAVRSRASVQLHRRRRRHGDRHRHDGLAGARRRRAAARRGHRRPRAQHGLRRAARRATPCSRRGRETARHRHRRGGHRQRRARRRGREPRRRARSPCRCASSACRGEFAPTGSAAFLLEHFGLTADGIAAAARDARVGGRALSRAPGHRPGHQRDQGAAGRPRAARSSRRGRARSAAHPQPGLGRAVGRGDLGTASGRRRARAWTARTPDAVVAVGLSTQRESLRAVGPRDRRAARPAAQLAGPAHRRRVRPRCAAQGAGELVARRQRAAARPDVLGAEGALAARPLRPRPRAAAARGELCLGTVDSWLLQPLRRRARRSRSATPRAPSCSTSARAPGTRGCSSCSASRRRCCPASSPRPGPFPPVARPARRCRTACRSPPCWATPTPRCSPTPAGGRAGQGDLRHRLLGHGLSPTRRAPATGPVPDRRLGRPTRPSTPLEGNIRASRRHADLAGRAARHARPTSSPPLAAPQQRRRRTSCPPSAGSARPGGTTRRSGCSAGLTFGTGLPQLARAALESIAFQVEDVVAAVDRATGPVADAARRRRADRQPDAHAAAGRHQRAPRSQRALARDLSALGAAHLAGRAAGVWDRRASSRRSTASASVSSPRRTPPRASAGSAAGTTRSSAPVARPQPHFA